MQQHLRWAFAGRGGLPHVFDDLVLCVSELVTTAVEARSSRILLTLDSTADAVRLAMTDDSPDSAAAAQLRRGANGHRTRILDAVATRWGVTQVAGRDEIWIEFALPGPSPRVRGLATRR
ncbi:MAG: hypothetical protein QOI15_2490 [Pseudonocardiales bacterium]|nr:hypothetical protein [Pseudonocardiales bacterium]